MKLSSSEIGSNTFRVRARNPSNTTGNDRPAAIDFRGHRAGEPCHAELVVEKRGCYNTQFDLRMHSKFTCMNVSQGLIKLHYMHEHACMRACIGSAHQDRPLYSRSFDTSFLRAGSLTRAAILLLTKLPPRDASLSAGHQRSQEDRSISKDCKRNYPRHIFRPL